MYPFSVWPTKDLTFEQDLFDLGWHQKEFQRRSSFAYTVVSLDESQVIGCIYINPTTKGLCRKHNDVGTDKCAG